MLIASGPAPPSDPAAAVAATPMIAPKTKDKMFRHFIFCVSFDCLSDRTRGAVGRISRAPPRADPPASRSRVRATVAQNKYIFEEKAKALFAANRRA
jgi:hypothetical protein